MFKIGAIHRSRCKQNNDRTRLLPRGDLSQGLKKIRPVTLHRLDGMTAKPFGKGLFQRPAIFQNIGNPGGAASIVLQNHILSTIAPNQIRPTDVNIDIERHLQPGNFPA